MTQSSGLKLPILSAVWLAASVLKGFDLWIVGLGTAIFWIVDRWVLLYHSYNNDNGEAEKTLKERKEDKRLVS